MEKSIFFNSAPGDPRTYQASDFAGYFGTVLSSGLFNTDLDPALNVNCSGTNMQTYVNPGKAVIEGYFYENTSDLYLTHALPEASVDRIDRIVLRLDKRNQSRFIRLFIIQGISASVPLPPDLQRDESIYELCLAEIVVRANTSTLVPSDLVDKRLDESLCGLAYSLISIPTSQFQDEWDTFMASVQTDYTSQVPYAVATGAANVYAISLPIASLVAGMGVSVKINIASTGASTLNWNGKGAKGIKKPDGTNMTNLKANGVYTFRYDGANFIVQGEGGGGNAVAADLLEGKTATSDIGDIVGTITNMGVGSASISTINDATGNLSSDVDSISDGGTDQSIFLSVKPLEAYYNGVSSKLAIRLWGPSQATIKAGVHIGAPNSPLVGTFTSDANAVAGDMVSGKSGYVNGTKIQGNIPKLVDGQQLTSVQGVSGGVTVVSPRGYTDGTVHLLGFDANFKAANIARGMTLLGLLGSGDNVTKWMFIQEIPVSNLITLNLGWRPMLVVLQKQNPLQNQHEYVMLMEGQQRNASGFYTTYGFRVLGSSVQEYYTVDKRNSTGFSVNLSNSIDIYNGFAIQDNSV